VWVGLVSLVAGAYTSLPQVILNFKIHSADGLSFGFLLLLLAGDICNLVGCIITHGLVTQLICAGWFILLDGFCSLQYIYYVWIIPKACPSLHAQYATIARPPITPLFVAAVSAASPYKPPELWGTLLGWFSAVAYASSRIPMIYHIFRRRKTEGLSIQYFIAALLQNGTYAASIFLWDSRWPYVWTQFPWIAGSAGVMVFDVVVIGQFLVFGAVEEAKTMDEPLMPISAQTDEPKSIQLSLLAVKHLHR
jgi:uncharacterized protein with PQ loop repeat